MFFNSFADIARTVIVAVLAYVALVLLLRISGKRTLSKMNAFDLIMTVALGSTLATAILSKEVALAEGVTAFAMLVLLQFVVTWLSVRLPWVRRIVTSEPTLLVYQGQFLEEAMRYQRVLRAEVQAAIREQGLPSVQSVEAVVLETDGSFSVMPKAEQPVTVIENVSNFPRKAETVTAHRTAAMGRHTRQKPDIRNSKTRTKGVHCWNLH